MNSASNQTDIKLSEQTIEQIRRQINRLFDEVAHLAEQELAPAQFYGEFLQRALQGIAAPAGAVWLRTAQGHLQLQFQINMRQVGLDTDEAGRHAHDELLRQTCLTQRPACLPPHSGSGASDGSPTAAGNPTNFVILLAPILVEKQVSGLVEVWQDPRHNPDALPGFLQFLVRMATLASVYLRNAHLRQMVGQQQVWTQLEAFARQVHSSLNPTEVSYLIANEGRRLIECDRVSVSVRDGRKLKVEAISGTDVIEKRSNMVQLLRRLAEDVSKWGERLIYQGAKDDTLPPDVLKSLDSYLAESNSKLLVVQPLHDEREGEEPKSCRAIVIMESFEPPASSDQLLARMEVLSRHSTSALYNAVEHRRIPLRWIWMPLAKLQDGLGGKTRAIIAAVATGILLLIGMLVLVPYPLKMDAKGNLLPEQRRWVYSPTETAQVVDFLPGIEPGATVKAGQDMIKLLDPKLELKMIELRAEAENASKQADSLRQMIPQATNPTDRFRLENDRIEKELLKDRKNHELTALCDRINAHRSDAPGEFRLVSPIDGTILNRDFLENLRHRTVKPSDPLLRVGDLTKPWEIELKIPQKHIGQVLQAFPADDDKAELDVDLLLLTAPTRTFKGKLARNKVSGEAQPNHDDNNETEPVVIASVRIDGPDIPEEYRIPADERSRTTGTEVHAKIRCGNRAMGYSLFYGVWEFLYEKVVFWF